MSAPLLTEYAPLTLHFPATLRLSDEAFFDLCQANRELAFERTATGDIIVMVPTGWETSRRNAELVTALGIWARQDGTGIVTDSSGGFLLPNGAVRAPDVAWIQRSKLASLTDEEKEKFLPLAPDFVIELRSTTDSLKALKEKMEEYISNGVGLAWLIDPEQRQVYVYRPNQSVEQMDDPTQLSGEPLLPGFMLDLLSIWEPGI